MKNKFIKEVAEMKKIIISIILMVTGNLVFGQNLDTYFSYLEIVSVNPRAAYDLLSGTNSSSLNLDRVSSVFGTQFNVVVEEGLEETWNKLKTAYRLNPRTDWVKTRVSKDEIEENFAIAYNRNDVRMLFVTKTHLDFHSIFRQDWAVFVQDPKGILKKGDAIQAAQAAEQTQQQAEKFNESGAEYYRKGDYDRAIADVTEAIRLQPTAARYKNRGQAYYNKSDYDKAIADFTEAIRLNPNNANAYDNRGSAYFGKKDYDRAIADYDQAIRINSNSTGIYRRRGVAYMEKGDYAQARRDIEKSLQIDPNNQTAKDNLTELQRREGN